MYIQYWKQDIVKALESIQNADKSIKSASKKYKIPVQTLRDHLKGANIIRTKKLYSPETVIQALSDINNKTLSVIGASKKYKIPAQTLRDRLKGKHKANQQVLVKNKNQNLQSGLSYALDLVILNQKIRL